MHAFDNIDRTGANANDNRSGAGKSEIVNLQSRIFERHHGRGIGKLRMTCHALGLEFWFDIFRRIKILHFPGDLAFEIAEASKSVIGPMPLRR